MPWLKLRHGIVRGAQATPPGKAQHRDAIEKVIAFDPTIRKTGQTVRNNLAIRCAPGGKVLRLLLRPSHLLSHWVLSVC
jgi:hypothetical protein